MQSYKALLFIVTLVCNQSYVFTFWGNNNQEDLKYFEEFLNGLQNKERLAKQPNFTGGRDLYSLLTWCGGEGNLKFSIHTRKEMCDAGINELKAIIRELKLQNPHDKRLFDLRYLKNKSINRKFYSAKTFK